jgi:hypothetical protein
MARELLPYFNVTRDGKGLEGLIAYSNTLTGNWFVPIFLIVFYGLSIYVLSKSEWKMGGIVLYTSFLFFILSWIAQTIVAFNQIVIFGFFVGVLVGIVMTYIENAKT